MTMSAEQIGLELVLKNQQQFLQGLKTTQASIAGTAKDLTGLEKSAGTAATSLRQKLGSTLDSATQKAKGFGSTLGDVGKIAGGFVVGNIVANAAQQVTGFISASVDAASNLGESINAVNQIFGTSADQILDWGKQNATSFGLSQRAFKRARDTTRSHAEERRLGHGHRNGVHH